MSITYFAYLHSDASVHDSQAMEQLLTERDEEQIANNKEKSRTRVRVTLTGQKPVLRSTLDFSEEILIRHDRKLRN